MRQPLNWIMLYLFCGVAFALPSDEKQLLYVSSDSWSYNSKSGMYIYEGHVKAKQGTTTLLADRLTTHRNAQHKMDETIAYGLNSLAEYSTIPKIGDSLFTAKARIIKFYPLTSTIKLQDDVIVTHGKNTFNGPNIIYNMKDQIITAPTTSNGRANMIIDPKQLSS